MCFKVDEIRKKQVQQNAVTYWFSELLGVKYVKSVSYIKSLRVGASSSKGYVDILFIGEVSIIDAAVLD